MPSRRTTLSMLGLLAAGGTGAVATGAFSAATAERDVTVEFEDDADAILGLEATSSYADADGDGTLGITFDELNVDTDFTFQDTFRIVNNGTEPVTFDRIQSVDGGEEPNWNYEDESSPAHVLIADEKNAWQGEPNTEYIVNDDLLDDDLLDDDTDVGRSIAASALESGEEPTLEPSEWISIGFGFWGTQEDDSGSTVGNWDAEDIPEVIGFNFGG